MFAMYTDENDGKFFSGQVNGSWNNAGGGIFWRDAMRPYSKDDKTWLCPQATKFRGHGGGTRPLKPDEAWILTTGTDGDPDIGSYGVNGWILNPPAGTTQVYGRDPVSDHWRTNSIAGANNIPVFTACWWTDSWPTDVDVPPLHGDRPSDTFRPNEMSGFA